MNSICAPSTPAGGAIGIIRVSGDDAIALVDRIFSKDIKEAKGYTLHYGDILKGEASLDTVLLSIFRAPHSYTGEDAVEIAHHGSPYIQRAILDLLLHEGCRMADPGEFTRRAYLNGKMDLSQAEAVADLIASSTASQHRVAMQQMRGGITQKLSHLRDELLQMTSLLELELDFSEEDVEFADRQRLITLAHDIEQEILRLTSSFAAGNAIKKGIPVAIIGAPNVGKSTLLNQLLQDDKAIVSDIAVTTRDLIEDTITLDGFLFRFIDTAGIRHTDDTIERLGIDRSLRAVEQASIVIMMTEPGVPYPDLTPITQHPARPEGTLAPARTPITQHVIRILNKSEDFQALTGRGIPELIQQLTDYAHSLQTTESDVLITNLRHKEALDLALTDIRRSLASLERGITGDLVAEDLRLCLTHLSDILGTAITPTEVLQNIFSHFCIGK